VSGVVAAIDPSSATDPSPASTFDPADDAAIAAAFVVAVVDSVVDVDLPRTLACALEVWGAGVDEAPLAVVHDLAHALWCGRSVQLVGGRAPAGLILDDDDAAALRTARLAWQDRVVAPWLADPSFVAAHVVIAGAPAAARGRLLAHAVALVLGRVVGAGALPAGNVARLRSASERWSGRDRVVDRAALAARTTPQALIGVLTQLDAVGPTLAARRLFLEEELWELAHLVELPSEAARLALRTVHRTSAAIPRLAPALQALLRRRARDVPVDAEAPDTFPAGGFDAMSTKGALENLVRTEVAWVGEGATMTPDGRPGPDLFDVRFVEGELLFYTRDESPLLLQRRALVIVVEEADQLRHKVPTLPTQTLVLVQAVALRAFHDLVDVVGAPAVQAIFALGGDQAHVVAEEQALLALSLQADVAHRRAAVVAQAEAPATGRVVFSPRPSPARAGRAAGAGRDRLWLHVGGPVWTIDDGRDVEDVDVATPAGLRHVVDRILADAVAGPRPHSGVRLT
jgi:hypothetical protein